MALSPRIVGNGMTQLEEDKRYVKLPTADNKPYLRLKAEIAVRHPNVRLAVRKDGRSYEVNARQAAMSGAIRGDEENHDYLWYYKAEVSFDMPLNSKGVPRPFLSSTQGKDPNRRHSLTPFPLGMRKNYLRRPDLIIVKDKAVRWPGRATTDHDGISHGDNLHRVVEIKFPGDSLNDKQAKAYEQIAGGRDRVTLLHVIPPDERKKQPQTVPKTAPVLAPKTDGIPRGENRRIPIYGPKPLPDPAFYEPWLDEARQLVYSLAEDGRAMEHDLRKAASQLSAKVQAELQQYAPWLFTAGRWLQDKAGQAWHFVDEQGQRIASWTEAQLKAAWAEIQRATDLTLDTLWQIDWTQVLLGIGQGLLVVGVLIAGTVAVFVLGGWLVAALAALVEMGIIASAAVATMLGAGAVATTA